MQNPESKKYQRKKHKYVFGHRSWIAIGIHGEHTEEEAKQLFREYWLPSDSNFYWHMHKVDKESDGMKFGMSLKGKKFRFYIEGQTGHIHIEEKGDS